MRSLGNVLAMSGAGAADDFWYQPRGTVENVTINDAVVMSLPTFYACTTAICEDVAKVPFGVYEDLGDRGRAPARSHPVHELIHTQPNELQTSLEWREMVTAFAILRGKGISEIRPGRRGAVDQIVPLHPDLIREDTADTGERRYWYRDPKLRGQERPLLTEDLHIIRGRFGRSVVDFARSQVVMDTAMERTALFMFTRGPRHQGVLQHPKLLSETARKNLRKALNEYEITGSKAGKPMLLEEGMTWQSVSLSPKDQEFLLSRQFSLGQWERFFRIPAHKIQDLTRSTNNNIQQQSIDYVTDAILGWAVRWEQASNRDLIVDRARYFTKLTLDALMRGDTRSRYEAYALAVQWGWMTRNEVRELEDMNPLDGLEEPLTPLNMGRGSQGTTGPTSQATSGYLRLLAADAAQRVVRREQAAVAKLAERTGGDRAAWLSGLDGIYTDHAATVARDLHVPDHVARQYAREQLATLITAKDPLEAMSGWLIDRVPQLAGIAIEQHRTEIAA